MIILIARCSLPSDNAEQAIEKNPKEPFARLVASWAAIFEKDLDRAKSEAEIALSLNPNSALSLQQSWQHSYLLGTAAGGDCGDRARHAPRPRLKHAISPLPRHGVPACRQVRNSGGSCSGSAFCSCPRRILAAPCSLPLLVISVRSRRPVASGTNSRDQSEILIQRTFRAGNPSGKRTSKGLPRALRKPDCRTNARGRTTLWLSCRGER